MRELRVVVVGHGARDVGNNLVPIPLSPMQMGPHRTTPPPAACPDSHEPAYYSMPPRPHVPVSTAASFPPHSRTLSSTAAATWQLILLSAPHSVCFVTLLLNTHRHTEDVTCHLTIEWSIAMARQGSNRTGTWYMVLSRYHAWTIALFETWVDLVLGFYFEQGVCVLDLVQAVETHCSSCPGCSLRASPTDAR